MRPIVAALAVLLSAAQAHAAAKGSEHWQIDASRCEEFYTAYQAMVAEKYMAKLSFKFTGQILAFKSSNCSRRVVLEFDPSKQDRAAYEEILVRMKIS